MKNRTLKTITIVGLWFVCAPVAAQTHWWNDAVFYEVFVRSFYDTNADGKGDFKGLIEKLDYLNDGDPATSTDLGITAIWLMPVSSSPSYHGYDVTNYKSIESDYGTKQDFLDFMDAAHARGIKVIVDFVMNHSSTEHPWFQQSAANDSHYRNFYRWAATDAAYTGPWGQDVWHLRTTGNYYYGLFWSGMPDLNYEYQPVKDSLFAAATYWLDEMNVDGFRCDAVKYIYENGNQLENIAATYQFWRDFRTHYKSINPEAMAVGEAWDATSVILNYSQGDGFDFCFEFNLADAIINAVNTGNTTTLSSTAQNIYNQYPYLQFATFLTNHDQNRVIEALGNNIAKNKLAAALYLTLPGVPFLYYGEEIGMKGVKPDEDIRRPMQWSAGVNAGFSSATPWRSVNSNFATTNVTVQQADPSSLLSWYKKLIALRHSEPALRTGAFEVAQTSAQGIFAFVRWDNGEPLVVAVNTSNQSRENVLFTLASGEFPDGTVYAKDLLNAKGRDVSLITSQQLSIGKLDAMSASVYKLSNVVGVAEVAEELHVYPNPVQDWLVVEPFTGGRQQLKITDAKGRGVEVNTRRTDNQLLLDVASLPAGLYLLTLEGARAYRFVKH